MRALKGELYVPSDKSICHRAVLFAALAEGKSKVAARSIGKDNFASVRAVASLGAKIQIFAPENMIEFIESQGLEASPHSEDDIKIEIDSPGFSKLTKPADDIYCGNSGTTSRLLCGILAGLPFTSRITGDLSLSGRPFARVKDPLELMGAQFSSERLPIEINGGKLEAIDFLSPRASAQVKSAILLAGLFADGDTTVVEPRKSRDHTERMLTGMGAQISSSDLDGKWKVTLENNADLSLQPIDLDVPGDFSSAAFFIVAASLIPGSEVLIKNVGINPTRIGLLNILKRMNASIAIQNPKQQSGEPVADLLVKHSKLIATDIGREDVVDAIDEIPILAVACAFADGISTISGAEELRVKETDRLSAMKALLESGGVSVDEKPDGLVIRGGDIESSEVVFESDSWQSSHDHRIEMAASIFNLVTLGELRISDKGAIETSFPNFLLHFKDLLLRGCPEK